MLDTCTFCAWIPDVVIIRPFQVGLACHLESVGFPDLLSVDDPFRASNHPSYFPSFLPISLLQPGQERRKVLEG